MITHKVAFIVAIQSSSLLHDAFSLGVGYDSTAACVAHIMHNNISDVAILYES
jgi:hypothetical protein